METTLNNALDAASDAGATYADARSVEVETLSISVRGQAVESVERSTSVGVGVRVLVDGAWGYAAASVGGTTADHLARTAVAVGRASARLRSSPIELVPEPRHEDRWTTPFQRDPFEVPLEDQLALLTSATGAMSRVPGLHLARGTIDAIKQNVMFRSTEGSAIEQFVVHSGAGIEATAISDGEVQTRSYPGSFRGHLEAGGYEVIERMDLVGHAQVTAEEAMALLSAPECPSEVTSLVLDGHQVMLQVHESVGHPTELDRVLGMEAAYAGTSFVGIEDIGRLQYGSPLVTIQSDATTPGGLGTYGYDDEGVEGQCVDLIRDGVLVGMQTSRETATAVGAERSNGTMRADGWENFPLIRMTNINLLPVEGTLEEIISDTGDGIFMATNKAWSIDDKRKNFQFGCEIGWEIKNGRLGRMFKNPRYTGITTEFWNACDAIAGPTEWKVWGTPNCGKGQPGQTMRVGHGTSPARFRNASIGVGQ